MDWAWANAVSPIAVLLVGWWINRSGERRTQRQLAASAAAKIAADGAAALARENLQTAIGIEARSARIETKVDGRLTKAVDDLAAANAAIAQMGADNAVFQGRLLRLLDAPADVKSAVRALEAEAAPDPKAGVMSVDWTQKK